MHHDNTIKEAFNRQLAAKKIKIFWDLNPEHPKAPIYVDYLDKWEENLTMTTGSTTGGLYLEATNLAYMKVTSPTKSVFPSATYQRHANPFLTLLFPVTFEIIISIEETSFSLVSKSERSTSLLGS